MWYEEVHIVALGTTPMWYRHLDIYIRCDYTRSRCCFICLLKGVNNAWIANIAARRGRGSDRAGAWMAERSRESAADAVFAGAGAGAGRV